MRSESVREQTGTRGVAAEGEAVGGVGAVEEALTMTVADALETVDGAVEADAPDPHHGQGPGHFEDVVLLLVTPLSVQGVLGPALSALPEGIAPRDGTRGPALPHPVDDNVLSLPHLPVNACPVLVARSVIAAVPLLAEGDTRQKIVPGHVVGALAMGQVGVVGVPPFHGAESGASPDLLRRKVGGAKEAQAIAAAALVVNLPLAGTTWTPIVVA